MTSHQSGRGQPTHEWGLKSPKFWKNNIKNEIGTIKFRQDEIWPPVKMGVANRRPKGVKSPNLKKYQKWNRHHQITINANFQPNQTKLKNNPHGGGGYNFWGVKLPLGGNQNFPRYNTHAKPFWTIVPNFCPKISKIWCAVSKIEAKKVRFRPFGAKGGFWR